MRADYGGVQGGPPPVKKRCRARRDAKKLRNCLEVVEQALADRDYLLGAEFGAADIMMGYSLQLVANHDLLDDRYPNARTYLDRLRKRDACKRAMSA